MKNVNIAFISHGGGPMPLFDDPAHAEMVSYLKSLPQKISKPSAILLISAHWETEQVMITAQPNPELIYDYYGFPAPAYEVKYPSPGEPELAKQVQQVLKQSGIPAKLEYKRGYDHGVYVPLTLMYPAADIPVIQLSLVNSLDPALHLAIGKALQLLDYDNLLVIGSGFSFHNMKAFFAPNTADNQLKNQQFEDWLSITLSDKNIREDDRNERMTNWVQAPHARYCHPREEHLLPLHVCYGLAGRASDEHENITILNKQSSAFIWHSQVK